MKHQKILKCYENDCRSVLYFNIERCSSFSQKKVLFLLILSARIFYKRANIQFYNFDLYPTFADPLLYLAF